MSRKGCGCVKLLKVTPRAIDLMLGRLGGALLSLCP
jgi:hypothetical protein